MVERRLALFGSPGAGKSTTAKLLNEICQAEAIDITHIRLADPLYECQEAIYRIAGKPLSHKYVQDGELLNFLGSHLRKINPNVLLEQFTRSLRDHAGHPTTPGRKLLVCDDMRAMDAACVRENGFLFVRIEAEPGICAQRRRARGDQTLGSETHVTEQGVDRIPAGRTVRNTGSLEELRTALTALVAELFQ